MDSNYGIEEFMNKRFLAFTLCALLGGTSFQVFAHRVNVFAWQEGDTVSVEGKFVGGRPAMNSEVLVQDSSGKIVAQGKTNQKGEWNFLLPEGARQNNLKIVLKAGEGHQATWDLEFETNEPKSSEAQIVNKSEEGNPVESDSQSVELQIASAVQAERARLEKEVIGPLRKQVAELQEPQVGWREIFGGIGWIIGLFGIGAYFKSRSKKA